MNEEYLFAKDPRYITRGQLANITAQLQQRGEELAMIRYDMTVPVIIARKGYLYTKYKCTMGDLNEVELEKMGLTIEI